MSVMGFQLDLGANTNMKRLRASWLPPWRFHLRGMFFILFFFEGGVAAAFKAYRQLFGGAGPPCTKGGL